VRLQPRHASLIVGDRRSNSGSLAKFTAIRQASSRVSKLGRRVPSRLIFEIDVGERLHLGVADAEAGVRLFGDPRRREAAGQARLFT
jgi:hypothetical protein